MSESKKIDLSGVINVPHLWRGILDSYHNFYDLISELVQNSVDSVRKANNVESEITVSFDQQNQTITVLDNGIGISEDELAYFALGNTNKSGEEETIGEKGLGASFILGISDEFHLTTVKNEKKITAKCLNAHETIMGGKIPEFEYEIESSSEASYCKITVVTGNIDLYFNSFEHYKFTLRTRTAIGNTTNLFEEEQDREKVSIIAEYTDSDGETKSTTIPFLYQHFDEVVGNDFPVFDAEYSKKNKKWIVDTAEIERKPRGILRLVDYERKIYLTFAQAEIYEKYGDIVGDERYPDDIVVSIKGCPTSVSVNKPRLGKAGYFTNFHIVIDNNSFVLDAGRKTIRREDADEVRDGIKSFFNDVVKVASHFMNTPHDAIGEGAGLDQIKERARETENLAISAIPFSKIPRHEQSVVGIFHEMLGAGVLKGYKTLLVSQYNTFDLLFEYTTDIKNIGKNPREVYLKGAGKNNSQFKIISFGEFKQRLGAFCKDVDSEVKGMEHVNLVICWDSDKLPNGWDLRKIYEEERIYEGADYILERIGFKKFHVMIIKDFHDAEIVS